MWKLAGLVPVLPSFSGKWLGGFLQLHFELGLEVGKWLPGCLSVPRLVSTVCILMQCSISTSFGANPVYKDTV